MKRRRRSPDPLASTASVRAVLREVCDRVPAVPRDERLAVSMLRAAIYAERRPAAPSGRGRKARWAARDLAAAVTALRGVLAGGRYGNKDARSYVEHYLRVLGFPADVTAALERGEINLFEAEQLARLTPRALGATAAAARSRRQALLRAHLKAQESGAGLRARVGALLAPAGGTGGARQGGFSAEVLEAAERLEHELADGPEPVAAEPSAVFFDLLSTIAHALNDVDPGELSPEDQERIFEYGDKILLVLTRVRRRRERQLSRGAASLGF